MGSGDTSKGTARGTSSGTQNGTKPIQTKRVNKKAFRQFLTEGYTKEDIEGFHKGTYEAYRNIISQRPDAIIAPLRGAEPLTKVMQLYANLERSSSLMPRIYYPKTGQLNSNVPEGLQRLKKVDPTFDHSMPESEQKREMRRAIDKIIQLHKQGVYGLSKNRILITLVDEVWSGGALTQMTNMLEDIIAEKRKTIKIDLNIISIADANHKRCPEYIRLKNRGIIKEYTVPKLFTTDSPKFLYPLKMEKIDFFSFRRPFKERRIERAYTQQAFEGRMRLLEALAILHNNGHRFGNAKKQQLMHRLPTNLSLNRRR